MLSTHRWGLSAKANYNLIIPTIHEAFCISGVCARVCVRVCVCVLLVCS